MQCSNIATQDTREWLIGSAVVALFVALLAVGFFFDHRISQQQVACEKLGGALVRSGDKWLCIEATKLEVRELQDANGRHSRH